MNMYKINEVIDFIANNDNTVDSVDKTGNEYLITIRLWNNKLCKLKTQNCKSLSFKDEFVSEIFDIVVNDGKYRFLTQDNEEAFLEFETDDIIIDEMG